jgi:uncharacterized protein YndB with AHSA1/START domain
MALFRLDFIDYSTEIDAPVEEVFAFFKDVEKWPSWTTGIKKAYRKSPGEWGVGFKLGFKPDFAPAPVDVKVLDFEEGRLVAWGLRTPVGTLIHRFDFEPLDEGRCRVRHTEYAEGLFAILTRPMRRKIESFDRLLADDLQAAFKKA